MSFTFDPSLEDNISLVRFHIGDNHDDGYFVEDETIKYFLEQTDSVGRTVLMMLKYIINQLAEPDFKLDWMSVSNTKAAEMKMNLLKQKAQEFGISLTGVAVSSVISNPTRADSDQEGDY